MELTSEGDDWKPTPHGQWLAHVLAHHNFVEGKRVLELGAGTANHTILMLRQGPARLVATEYRQDLIDSTRKNVERNLGPDAPIEYQVADWLHLDGEFDLVVTNPPFCKSGKQNRRYFIDALILDAHKRLVPGGELVFVQSSMANLALTGEMLDRNGWEWRVVDTTEGPFRDYYYTEPGFMDEIQAVPGLYERRGDTDYEKLHVVHAKLKPWPRT